MSAKIFISYSFKHPDSDIANQFAIELNKTNETFLASESIKIGDNWADKVDNALETCDYFIIFLSERSLQSEMVTEEVRRAKKLRESRASKKPVILPIRINLPFEKDINYDLAGYLNRIQQRLWKSEQDTHTFLNEIKTIIDSDIEPVSNEEDKIALIDTEIPLPNAPLELEIPSGTVSLQSKFYIERDGEHSFISQILTPGSLLRIKAPRQFGKTSMLSRITRYAKENNFAIVSLSFQQFDEPVLSDSDKLYRQFCSYISRKLKLPKKVDEFWEDNDDLGLKMRCSAYIEEYVLDQINEDIVIAIDEADRLFKYGDVSSDFFSMLRVWHEDAKNDDVWKRIHMIVTYSTEVNLSIQDLNQSPFNVGLAATLKEFSQAEVRNLTQRHQLNWDDLQIGQFMDVIGGYPFLVRKALYQIANKNISFDEFVKYAAKDDGPFGDHLRRHLSILSRRSDLTNELKFIMKNNRANDMHTFYKLLGAGLVKGESSNTKISYKLYHDYFINKF